MISQQTIDRVFEAARVEEVISEFVQLKKSGANFKGLSPFSNERTPSFMVSPVKQIWKDFSTGKGGNAVSFLMEHEHYSYPEAIKYLAKKYNITVEQTQQSDEQKQEIDQREGLFVVSEFAKDYFHDLLFNSEQGKSIGLTYFKERGFRREIIEKFELGYAENQWDNFTKYALDKGYSLDYLEKTGLTIVKENKKFDRFKGRVLFPIHSMSGRVLGFGARTLSKDKKIAKYLNSPESPIYHKSDVLYGIYQARKQIAKLDNCLLVEGYTDVISLYQSGIENVVASSGTSLTNQQIRLINRLTKNITVLFDGDEAGIRASIRGIDLILEQGMNVKVVLFPKGEDPDSFVKSHSDQQIKDYIENSSQDFINFKVSLLIKQADEDPVKKAELIRDIIASISKIPSDIQKQIYVQECARITNISERVLFGELAQLQTKNNRQATRDRQRGQKTFEVVKDDKSPQLQTDPTYVLEKEIVTILLLYGNEKVDFVNWIEVTDTEGKTKIEKQTYQNTVADELYINLQEDEIEFTNPIFRQVYYELINRLNQDKEISLKSLTNHSNPDISNMVSQILMEQEKYPLSNWERKEIYLTPTKAIIPKLVTDVILNIRRILIDKKINELIENIQSKKTQADLELITNYTQLKKRLFKNLNRIV